MIEINRSQILSFENKNKIEMLKLIAKGRVSYKGEWKQMITKETRQMSFEEIKPKRKKRYEEILDRLMTGTKTAKEIAVELYEMEKIGNTDRNNTAPRLTELEKMGYVKVIAKRRCEYTGKTVAEYEITVEGIKQRYMKHIPRID